MFLRLLPSTSEHPGLRLGLGVALADSGCAAHAGATAHEVRSGDQASQFAKYCRGHLAMSSTARGVQVDQSARGGQAVLAVEYTGAVIARV